MVDKVTNSLGVSKYWEGENCCSSSCELTKIVCTGYYGKHTSRNGRPIKNLDKGPPIVSNILSIYSSSPLSLSLSTIPCIILLTHDDNRLTLLVLFFSLSLPLSPSFPLSFFLFLALCLSFSSLRVHAFSARSSYIITHMIPTSLSSSFSSHVLLSKFALSLSRLSFSFVWCSLHVYTHVSLL